MAKMMSEVHFVLGTGDYAGLIHDGQDDERGAQEIVREAAIFVPDG